MIQTTILIIICLVINIIISNIIGKLGKEKKVGFKTAFWISFFLGPIIGLLIVIASVPINKEESKVEFKPVAIELTPEEKEREKSEQEFNNIIMTCLTLVTICVIIYMFYKNMYH